MGADREKGVGSLKARLENMEFNIQKSMLRVWDREIGGHLICICKI